MITLRARLFLLSHVCLTEECLGQEFPVIVGDVQGKLFTPSIDWTPNGPILKREDIPVVGQCYGWLPHQPPIDENSWGEIHTHHAGSKTCTVSVSSVVLECALEDREIAFVSSDKPSFVGGSAVLDLCSNGHAWLRSIQEWVGAVANQYSDDPRLRAAGDTANRIMVWAIDGQQMVPRKQHLNVTFTLHDTEALTKRQWKHVLARASAKDEVPMERLLLATARNALLQGRYRQAVLDAATATEIVLASLFEGELTQLPAALRKRLAEKRTLGQLVSLLHHLGLPPELQYGLVGTRNKAIHGGAIISASHASAAVRLAGDVLRDFASRLDVPKDP